MAQQSPQIPSTTFKKAIEQTNPEALRTLLASKADATKLQEAELLSLLTLAVQKHGPKAHEVLSLLLTSKIPIDHSGMDQPPPLFTAIQLGRVDAARLLLEEKADYKKVYKDKSVLDHALGLGDELIIDLLLKAKAPIDMSSALSTGNAAAVNVLLQNKAVIKNPMVLHKAVKTNSELVRVLAREKCGMESRDKHGNTPLMRALDTNLFDHAQILVEAKADLKAVDKAGYTIIESVLLSGRLNDLALFPFKPSKDQYRKVLERLFIDDRWEMSNPRFSLASQEIIYQVLTIIPIEAIDENRLKIFFDFRVKHSPRSEKHFDIFVKIFRKINRHKALNLLYGLINTHKAKDISSKKKYEQKHYSSEYSIPFSTRPITLQESGDFAIFVALHASDLDAVNRLLKEKPSLISVTNEHNPNDTPLSFAIQFPNNLPIVSALLAAKAEAKWSERFDRVTPLELAIRGEHIQVVKALLDAGAADHIRKTQLIRQLILPLARNVNPRIVELLIEHKAVVSYHNILKAITSGNEVLLPVFLQHKPDLKGSEGELLQHALPNPKILAQLIAAKFNPDHHSLAIDNSPLFNAVLDGHAESVEILLKSKADSTVMGDFSDNLFHQLMWCLSSQSKSYLPIALQLAAAKVDVNAVNSAGYTALQCAVINKRPAGVISALIAAKAHMANVAFLTQEHASPRSVLEALFLYQPDEEKLRRKFIRDSWFKNPNPEIMKTLVETHSMMEEMPILFLAAKHTYSKAVKILLECKADAATRDADDNTPLHALLHTVTASSQNEDDILSTLAEMVTAKTNVNAVNATRETAIQISLKKGLSASIITTLVSLKAEVKTMVVDKVTHPNLFSLFQAPALHHDPFLPPPPKLDQKSYSKKVDKNPATEKNVLATVQARSSIFDLQVFGLVFWLADIGSRKPSPSKKTSVTTTAELESGLTQRYLSQG